MNGVQTRFKCKLDVKRCKRFVFPPSSLLPRSNALKTKAIRYFQTDRTLTRIVSPPLERTLDRLAELLKSYPDSRFLITGYTDAKGSDSYNLTLSARRAEKVHAALIGRGVPARMIKWRGVGKRAAIISATAADNIREGDRKVLLERVTNMDYWNALDSK